MQFSHQLPSSLFIFLQWLPTISLFSYSHHLPYLFTISLIPQLPLFSAKTICSSLILSSLIIKNSLPFSNYLIFSMEPKSKTKKTSYSIFSEIFNLTCQDGATRLTKSPPLIYKPQNHLLEGCMGQIGKFFKLFSFFSFCSDLPIDASRWLITHRGDARTRTLS